MMRLGVDLQSLDRLRDFPEEGAVNDGSLSNFAGLKQTPQGITDQCTNLYDIFRPHCESFSVADPNLIVSIKT